MDSWAVHCAGVTLRKCETSTASRVERNICPAIYAILAMKMKPDLAPTNILLHVRTGPITIFMAFLVG